MTLSHREIEMIRYRRVTPTPNFTGDDDIRKLLMHIDSMTSRNDELSMRCLQMEQRIQELENLCDKFRK